MAGRTKKAKPKNAGIAFESAFIATATAAGFVTEKLSTPTPPPIPCRCGAMIHASRFTTKRPYDVLLVWRAPEPPGPQAIRSALRADASFAVVAIECKSSGKETRLDLDRIQSHQIRGLQNRAAAGWVAGLAIDLPKPAAEGEREWWWLPAHLIEVLLKQCAEHTRNWKSVSWVELREAGAVQISQNPACMPESLGVY